jgi:hypothetical protein
LPFGTDDGNAEVTLKTDFQLLWAEVLFWEVWTILPSPARSVRSMAASFVGKVQISARKKKMATQICNFVDILDLSVGQISQLVPLGNEYPHFHDRQQDHRRGG